MKLREYSETTITLSNSINKYLLCNSELAISIESNINAQNNQRIRFFELSDGNSYVNAQVLTDQNYFSGVVSTQTLDYIDVIDGANLTIRLPLTGNTSSDPGNVTV